MRYLLRSPTASPLGVTPGTFEPRDTGGLRSGSCTDPRHGIATAKGGREPAHPTGECPPSDGVVKAEPFCVAYEMSIEVLDGEFPARLWMEARGDALVEVALQCQVIEWRWQHFGWGTVLEIIVADEADWERFRTAPAVQAALDAVPDRVSGLMIYRGRGGTSAPREPRRPRPRPLPRRRRQRGRAQG